MILLVAVPFIGLSQTFYEYDEEDEEYHAIKGSVDFNIPIARLATGYKPGLGAHISYNWYDAVFLDRVVRLNFAIANFKPKEDTLHYSSPVPGTVVYTDYLVLSVTAHFEKTKRINKFGIYGGFDVGYAATHYSFVSRDKNISLGEESIQGKIIVAPEAGLNYFFTDELSAAFLLRYNALFTFAGDDLGKYYYNPVSGFYKNYASVSLRIAYTFYY